MSFVNAPIGEGREPEALPEGPYDVVITDAIPHHSEASGNDSIRLTVEAPGYDTAATIFHYIALPGENDDDKKRNTKLVMMKKFLEMFGVEFSDEGFDTDDLINASAKVWLDQEEDNNGIPRNNIKFKKVA